MTGRSLFRIARWVGLAAVAPVLWACNARTLEQPVLKPEQTFGKNFQQSINRNVDLLFMVDNSSSMRLSQNNLRSNFPTFMTRLKDPPGLPNIHVAVITSDMGAGDGSISGCNATGGNNGVFQYSGNIIPPATTPCATNLMQGNTFIADNGMGVSNYSGQLEDVFTCIAAVGEGGCGFEHQFASITRALGVDGRGGVPQENADFLRPEAYLVIVLITNEDDCSAAPMVPLFDTTANQRLTDQLGPPSNFRCNEFGHLCDGAHPSRRAPGPDDINQTVTYNSCTSNDGEGYLLGVVETANRIKALKSPGQVIVAAITGAPTPYQVHWKAPSTTDMSCGMASCPWPEISHSCTAQDGSFADPGVRVSEFVNQFGANGLVLSICDNSFAASLDRIAALINASLKPPCIEGKIAKKAGTQDLDCTVVSHTSVAGSNQFTDSTVPSCASNGGMSPCWQLTAGGTGCAGQIIDQAALMDPRITMSQSQNATVNCALCVAGVDDPARGCCGNGNDPDGNGCCPMNPTTGKTVCAS
jgi:hypothetical protein